MKSLKTMKKVIISVLLLAMLCVSSLVTVLAHPPASSHGPTYVAGGASYINWQFTSNAINGTYTWDYYRWDYATPATGVSITGKRAVKGANPREAYGRMSATYQGSSVLSDSIITWHRIANTNGGITVN